MSPHAVYVNTSVEEERVNYVVVKTIQLYTYIRFFNDGKVFVSFTYLSYPNEKEFNDLTYGRFGRYLTKDGKIKVELYMNKQHGIMYMFAKHTPNGIQFYKTTGRGLGQVLKVSKTTDGGFYQLRTSKLDN